MSELSGQQAFLLLVHASHRTNVKLRDIADQLAVSGEFHRP